jgi:hypothetical protein
VGTDPHRVEGAVGQHPTGWAFGTQHFRRLEVETVGAFTGSCSRDEPMMSADALVHQFTGLLRQAVQEFPDWTGMRLIEPVTADSIVAIVAVRLVLLRRTIEAELARALRAS